MDREWKVLRNGKLWTDRFSSENSAYAHILELECQNEGEDGEFTVEEMTEDEINAYYIGDNSI